MHIVYASHVVAPAAEMGGAPWRLHRSWTIPSTGIPVRNPTVHGMTPARNLASAGGRRMREMMSGRFDSSSGDGFMIDPARLSAQPGLP
jgi:hypothetical protein